MNCIDLRRDTLAQPLRLSAEAQDHVRECAACRAFVERQRELEAELFEALRVPVPDGLADRVLVAHGIRRRRAPWLWALAASIMIAAGVATLAPPVFSGRALASEAIAHVREEPQSFTLATRHAPDLLAKELATQGVKLAGALGEVTYSVLCPMSPGRARHIVVATASGPVTLLLLPGDTRDRDRTELQADGMTAIALKAARGSIAIVASNRAQALAVEGALALS